MALAQPLLAQGVPCGAACAGTLASPAWAPPSVDVSKRLCATDGPSRLAAAIAAAPDGVLVLTNALEAPFDAIGGLFDRVDARRGERSNAVFATATSWLVWKDAHREGRAPTSTSSVS